MLSELDGCSVVFIQTESHLSRYAPRHGFGTKNSASGSRGKWWCSSSSAFGQWRAVDTFLPEVPSTLKVVREGFGIRELTSGVMGSLLHGIENSSKILTTGSAHNGFGPGQNLRGSRGVVLARLLLGNYHSAGVHCATELRAQKSSLPPYAFFPGPSWASRGSLAP